VVPQNDVHGCLLGTDKLDFPIALVKVEDVGDTSSEISPFINEIHDFRDRLYSLEYSLFLASAR
jgi:hypothetical protein